MDERNKPLLVVVLGPTACGKTRLAVQVAKQFNGEVVSGDSMQVYRSLDIGTAKVTAEEAAGVPHWLLDIREPDEAFSVADFRTEAIACIDAVIKRGHLPILCGGTGLYIDSLLKPYNFAPQSGADSSLRVRLRQELAEQGAEALHQRLATVDPAAAQRIHVNDSHRLLRALEVWQTTGRTISSLQEEPGTEPPYRPLIIGLKREREELYCRIEQRIDQMLFNGLLDEVRALLERGISREAVSMQGLGYRQMAAFLLGECSLEEATAKLKRDTRHFAKRQLTWFKRDPRIHWFDLTNMPEAQLKSEVQALITRALKEGDTGAGITGTVFE